MDIRSRRNKRAGQMPWLGCLLPGFLWSVPLAQQIFNMDGIGSQAQIRGLLMAGLLLPGVLAMYRLVRRHPYEGRLWRLEPMAVLLWAGWELYWQGRRALLPVVMRTEQGELYAQQSYYLWDWFRIPGGTVAVLRLAVLLLPLSCAFSLCVYQAAQCRRRHSLEEQSFLYRWGARAYRLLTEGKTLRRQAFVRIVGMTWVTAAAILAAELLLAGLSDGYISWDFDTLFSLGIAPVSVCVLGLLLTMGFCRPHGLFSQMEALQRLIGRIAAGDAAKGLPSELSVESFAEEDLPSRSPLYASAGQLCHISRTLEESIRQAVAGERLKVELLANVSHDLKTPLTAIIGYGECLAKEELPPSARQYVERLNHKAAYLYDVVQDVFELSKISSGSISVEMRPLDIKKLWEQTIGDMDDAVGRSGLTICRRYEGESFLILGDGARLHRVFQNLLDNALKYSLEGSRIYLSVEGAGEESAKVRITLVNTAAYEMDFDVNTITGRFVRGDAARSGEGSGLGLAIASTFTAACGGTLQVRTEYGQFRVELEFSALRH